VQGPVELQDGDEITLGTSLRLRFEAAHVKPKKEKSTQGQGDPCADLKTVIMPEKIEAPPSTIEIRLKIASVGNKMPTTTEVKEVVARIKDKAKKSGLQDNPESK